MSRAMTTELLAVAESLIEHVVMPESLSQALQNMHIEVARMKSDSAQLAKMKDESNRFQKSCFEKIRSMQTDLNSSAEKIKQLQEQLVQKEKKLITAQSELGEERADHLEKIIELEECQKANAILASDKSKLEHKVKELEKSKAFLKAHNEFHAIVTATEKQKLSGENEALTKEIRKARLRIYEQNYMIEDFQTAVVTLADQLSQSTQSDRSNSAVAKHYMGRCQELQTEIEQRDARLEMLMHDRASSEGHIKQLMKNYGKLQGEMQNALRLIRMQKQNLVDFEEQTMTSSSTHLHNNDGEDFFDQRLLYPTWSNGEAETQKSVYERFGV